MLLFIFVEETRRTNVQNDHITVTTIVMEIYELKFRYYFV